MPHALWSAPRMVLFRFSCLLLCLCCALGFGAPVAHASAPVSDSTTRISLVTMGRGDHLFTRGGHAALWVEWTEAGQREELVYNFGDADWDDPTLAWDFLMGALTFRLEAPGDLMTVAEDYGVRQNRDVYTQALALSHAQAESVRVRLEALNTDANRDYPHDYVGSICTTKARDIIDDVLGGVIHEQLRSTSDGMTIREHQRRAFNGKPLAGLGADLLLGLENDLILSRYDALFLPERMRVYLQDVQVDSPSGLVPLAAAPVQIAGRQQDTLGDGSTGGSWYFALPLIGWLAWSARRLGARLTLDGLASWALWPSMLFTVLGCALWGLQLLSHESGFQNNPLALAFVPMDCVLPLACARLKRGHKSWLTVVLVYVVVRGAMATGVLVINATMAGAAPLALPLLALVFFGLFAKLARRAQETA